MIRVGRSLQPSAETTSPVGYVRLHGRNYKNWFAVNQTVNDRASGLTLPNAETTLTAPSAPWPNLP